MHSIMVWPDLTTLRARSARALASVGMTVDALEVCVLNGTATPKELDAWIEVNTVRFLLYGRRRDLVPVEPLRELAAEMSACRTGTAAYAGDALTELLDRLTPG